MKQSKKPAPPPATRIAIYCRQSVASDLEFGSIDAQRESVEAFATSQRWLALPDDYSDGGFSGSNTERPAYQRLLADVAAGKIDVVGVYRIDRVSRSLADFTRFVELLDRHGVGFVSVTQSFDTRTSMGRLTLNILASFSQFERETIAERTRDKVIATRRKGLWTGGRPVLGYDVVAKQLVPNAAEVEQVRAIYRLYLDRGSVAAAVAEVARRGIRNKSWNNQDGRRVTGKALDKTTLRALLGNRLYLGETRCGDEWFAGRHTPIVERDLFDRVQTALAGNRRKTYREARNRWGALLVGIARCARCGAAFGHTYSTSGSRTHRYYACQTLQKRGAAACQGSRAPAAAIEDVVVARIRGLGTDPAILAATIAAARNAAHSRLPELTAETRRLTTEKNQLAAQRKNLLDAVAAGGAGASSLLGRIAELDAQIASLTVRHDEVAADIARISTTAIDEQHLRATLADFGPVWDQLIPRERARIVRLLVREVRFDAQAGELQIDLHDNGLASLAAEIGRMSA